MTIKKIFGTLHRWLGFIAGLVVLISLTAAAIFVWEDELNKWYHRDKLFVKEVKDHRLRFDELLAAAKLASANHTVASVKIDNNPRKAFVFQNFKKRENAGWTWASAIEDYSRIYVDPYTGKVLGVVDMRYDWIYNMRMLHQCLLLNYDVGHYIVGGATLLIFIMIITGIVLWWPKNKAALRQRLWFRWKRTTKWKRKNYDFHNIGGIYTFLLILLFAITGLVWTFDWWTNGIYRLLGNDPEKVFARPPKPAPGKRTQPAAVDAIVADASGRIRKWQTINITIPQDTGALKAVSSTIKYSSGSSGWDESDTYYYHPQTGSLYFTATHHQKTLGAKWRNSNYAIHVGNIYGWPTKVLACFIALFCASLPVTGFYIWWGRRKKKTAKGNIYLKAVFKEKEPGFVNHDKAMEKQRSKKIFRPQMFETPCQCKQYLHLSPNTIRPSAAGPPTERCLGVGFGRHGAAGLTDLTKQVSNTMVFRLHTAIIFNKLF